jgi:hypothetical protein
MLREMDEPENRAEAAERLRIRRWRFEQFVELGFAESDAEALAEATVDLGIMRRLIGAGCPRATASRIAL